MRSPPHFFQEMNSGQVIPSCQLLFWMSILSLFFGVTSISDQYYVWQSVKIFTEEPQGHLPCFLNSSSQNMCSVNWSNIKKTVGKYLDPPVNKNSKKLLFRLQLQNQGVHDKPDVHKSMLNWWKAMWALSLVPMALQGSSCDHLLIGKTLQWQVLVSVRKTFH